jgi:hypothetical protein
MSQKPRMSLNVLLTGFYALSPTRLAATLLKYRLKGKEASFIRIWTWVFLLLAICEAAVFQFINKTQIFDGKIWPVYVLVYLSLSRINEIFYAFLKDGLDRLKNIEPTIPLDAYDRIVLILLSYVEIIIDFSLIYYLSLSKKFTSIVTTMADALYLSAATITTLGGDLSPAQPLSKFFVIYEVLTGLILILVAFGAYMSGMTRRDTR